MECFSNIRIKEPYLYSCDGVVTVVNNEFIDLTGFTMNELIGKSLAEIGKMLKINSQLNLDNMKNEYLGFIFTKFMETREVNISFFCDKETNEKICTFVEKPNSRFEDKCGFAEQMLMENRLSIAIYSAADLTLLKANEKYFDFMASPFNKHENMIGRPIKEIIKGHLRSGIEAIWKKVCETKKTVYIKEFRLDDINRATTYWDSTATPIFENGKMKYIVSVNINVTERILKNKSIERQKKIIEKQKAQLEQKNKQLNSILENLSEGVVIRDSKGKVVMVNSEAKRLTFQVDKINTLVEDTRDNKYCDTEGNDISFEKLPQVRALRGEIAKNAKMLVRYSGKEFFVDLSSSPIYNTKGELTNTVTCIHDISETVLQSKKIEQQKKELDAIIENIADGISIFDNKGKYKLFNKSEREMFFKDDEYVNNIGDWDSKYEFYGVDGQKIDSEDSPPHRVMRGEKFKNMRMSIKLLNKTLQMDVSGTPIYDEDGKFSLGVVCSRDMKQYLKNEEILRSQYRLVNRIIDTFNLPVIRLACPDLKIVNINKKAFNMAKLLRPDIKSIKEIKESNIKDLGNMFKVNVYYKYIDEVLKEKKTKRLMRKKSFVNGNEMYSNIIFEPMFEANGELKEIIILIMDVTAEIKNNIIMEKTLASYEEFVANTSHELKTPLNVVFATSQILNMYCNNGSLDEKKNSIIKYIDSIKQNSYRLSKLIDNIVDLSKIKAGFFELNLSNENIVEIVEEIVTSVSKFTEAKGIEIIFDTDIEEKIIACDTEKIERMVLNLVSNAIKFSNEGDKIVVEIKDNNEFVEISVEDNGIGIEENDLYIIFDRFKQVDKSLSRNVEGTGIGLSLVKSFAELHDGSINVESKFGEGSKFTIFLPSRKVSKEDKLCSSRIRNKSELIQVELSDIYS